MKKVFIVVICVSFSAGAVGPFRDNGDGTVTDATNNLVWQKCSRGQNNDATCSGVATNAAWLTAISYCQTMILVGRVWRLPSINELQALADRTSSPAISNIYFPATSANFYWASTTFTVTPANAWSLTFLDGRINYNLKTSFAYIRCVATGP